MGEMIVISDVHLNKWQYGSHLDSFGKNSRLKLQVRYLKQIAEDAKLHGINHVFCLGDFFHTHQTVHSEVLNAAFEALNSFKKAGIQFHCLVGNHDMSSRRGEIHSLDFLRHYGTVVDVPKSIEIEGRSITACPYVENKDFLQKVLNVSHELVLLHQGINLNNRGSAWVLNEIFTKDMIPEHVKLVLTGHYHRPVDDGKVSVVGGLMEHNWNDCDGSPRGYIILDLDTLKIKRVKNRLNSKFIKIKYPDFTPSNITFNFVKVIGCPESEVEAFKSKLTQYFPTSLEFEANTSLQSPELHDARYKTVEEIVQNLMKSLTDPKLKKIGNAILEEKYEVGQV